MHRSLAILCFCLGAVAEAFSIVNNAHERSSSTVLHSISSSSTSTSRRDFFQTALIATTITSTSAASTMNPLSVWAAEDTTMDSSSSGNDGGQDTKSVQTPLYYILRVREATEQETRLIKSGKFKDVQRANVKLAVRFMIDNYRLNDNFIAASAFLTGDKKIKAVDLGQNVVQNLYTILEYFDSGDVENIKVGSLSMAGKEKIVIEGLTSARKGIDDYLSLFNKDDLNAVIARIEAENDMNRIEFDKDLNGGQGIINPKPTAEPYKVQE